MSKPNVFLKSTFRQPIFTIFLIILLGLISFAFTAKAVEYIVVQRETERLGGYFRSIGSLERLDKNMFGDVSQGANLIKSSPYLAYEDRLRYSSGVLRDIWNADIDHKSSDYSSRPAEYHIGVNNSDMWFYGTLIELDLKTSGFGWYKLTFWVDKVLAGYPEDVTAGSSLTLLFMIKDHEDAIHLIESIQEGQRYLIRGWWDYDVFRPTLRIRSLDDAVLWYLQLEESAELDFNDPALTGIKNEIDILNENQHALFIYGTSDMSALPKMQESSRFYYLVDGRWLNHQDDLDGRRVIVIHKEFARIRGLEVGDTISVTLRGLQDPAEGYIRGEDRENWRSYPTYEETFEIVGIYYDLLDLNLSSYSSWAYVPNSVLPADAVYRSDILYPQNYSFVLDSSRYQEAFINENKEPLAELGFFLTFVENNGAAFWASVIPLRRSALAGLLVYSLVLVVALTLAVFLYLNQRRRDYAILRALGVSRNLANRQLIIPIVLTGAAGVLTGGALAWGYTLEKTATTFSTLPTPAGILPSTTLNPIYLGAISMGILLLLLVFAWGGVKILAGLPVLELLGRAAPAGGTKKRAKPPQQTDSTLQSVPEERLWDETTGIPLSIGVKVTETRMLRGKAGSSALVRFGLRHIGRAGFKSALTILVALGFMLALGWMQWGMDRNRLEMDRLYETTVVEAEIVKANAGVVAYGEGLIAGKTVVRIMESGYIHSATLEATATVFQVIPHGNQELAQQAGFSILAFDKPEDILAMLETRDTVRYATGWDKNLFTKIWRLDDFSRQGGVPAVFPESILTLFNLNLGDVIVMIEESGSVFSYLVAGQYIGELSQYSENIFKDVGEPVLLPLSALQVIQGKNFYYSKAKFVIDPAKNREMPVIKEEITKMVSEPNAGRLPLQIVFWDEELRAVVEPMEKNLALLEVLFPVTVAVSVLIGIGLSLLLVLQQARETALLRMLGVRRAWVRAMLSSEQVLISLLGVILGLGLLVVLRQDPEAVLTAPALTTGGLYLLGALIGSLLGAIWVSNKQPLELLQVKE